MLAGHEHPTNRVTVGFGFSTGDGYGDGLSSPPYQEADGDGQGGDISGHGFGDAPNCLGAVDDSLRATIINTIARMECSRTS